MKIYTYIWSKLYIQFQIYQKRKKETISESKLSFEIQFHILNISDPLKEKKKKGKRQIWPSPEN